MVSKCQTETKSKVSHLKPVVVDSLLFSVGITIERFGEEERKASCAPNAKNHRAVKIHNIRQEMKAMKAQLICILHIRSGSSARPSGITGGGTKGPGNVQHLLPTLSSSPKSY